MEATVPWPAWGIHTSSKSVTQKANAAWKCFPQSYEIKPQHWASSHCQAASCHPEEVSPGFRFTPLCLATGGIRLQQLLGPPVHCSQHPSTKPFAPREPGQETPDSSSQVIPTSNLVHGEGGSWCTMWQWPFSRMWESDRLLFCLGVCLLLHKKKKIALSPVEK